jgi:hypothetical protein
MSILHPINNAFEREPDKEQVGQRVHDLGGIDGGVIVLRAFESVGSCIERDRDAQRPIACTSSHQLMVEVTGDQ